MNLLEMAMSAKMGGVRSYNDLEDKPFYQEGFGKIEMDKSGISVLFPPHLFAYLVSDQTPTRSQIIGSTASVWFDAYNSSAGNTIINDTHIVEDVADGMCIKVGDDGEYYRVYVFVAKTDNYQPKGFDNPLPSKGVYFTYYRYTDQPYVLSLESSGVLVKIDNKYLDLENHPVIKDILAKLG